MIVIIIFCWVALALQILNNFEEDLDRINWWKAILLQGIILLFAPVFLLEELLEISIDWILDEEE